MAEANIPRPEYGPWWRHWSVRYIASLLATVAALGIWFLWPVVQREPTILFIAAVIVSARFLGFGPALLCTFSSALTIDYFIFQPRFSFALSAYDYERILVFVGVSVLTAGIARQRSRAETRAERIHRLMAAIIESSDDAILTKDRDAVVTSWNRGAERLYGYPAAEMLGQHVAKLSPPEYASEIAGFMKRLLRGESIEHHATERLRKDGTRLTVDLSLSPVRNERGEIVGASSIAHDITAQRKAEEALRRSEKLATAGRLAAAVAHEINNPLEAVNSLLYLARNDPTARDQHLEMAGKEVHRIAEIAQQMLGIVREGASPAPLNVASTLDAVLQLYVRKLSDKQIQIERYYDPSVEIRGFAGELRQVFSNLILNAADAMGEGGRLTLHVVRAHQWFDGHRPGVRVTVADSGSGIGSADIAHIFEPFYTTKKDSGTGLGLWVSHAIVQKHGGSIRVRSRTKPGSSGTVFSVFLPETVMRSHNA
jgi:PAS domain S-box-containing protein